MFIRERLRFHPILIVLLVNLILIQCLSFSSSLSSSSFSLRLCFRPHPPVHPIVINSILLIPIISIFALFIILIFNHPSFHPYLRRLPYPRNSHAIFIMFAPLIILILIPSYRFVLLVLIQSLSSSVSFFLVALLIFITSSFSTSSSSNTYHILPRPSYPHPILHLSFSSVLS